MNLKKAFKGCLCLLISVVTVFNFSSCSKKITEEYEASSSGASTSASSPAKESQDISETEPATTKAVVYTGIVNPLTGIETLDPSAQGKRPYAVVVENSSAARPQWGISTPDILVEGMAEGGITRMLLLYSDVNSIPKIGPLRSARHDFVEISQCFDSIFVHCGWSTYAKKKIENEGVDSLNGILGYATPFFSRDSSRSDRGTEHTGYTTGQKIRATVSSLKYRTDVLSDYAYPLSFHEKDSPVTPSGGSSSSVGFTFSTGNTHTLSYKNGVYYDYLNGSARKDNEKNTLNYKNILVLFCSVTLMGDEAGCVDMALESSNTGYYVSNGGYEKISWTKTGSGSYSHLCIKDSAGNDITLNAGRTYIAIVPSSQQGTLKIS